MIDFSAVCDLFRGLPRMPPPRRPCGCSRLVAHLGQFGPRGVEVTLGALGPGARPCRRYGRRAGTLLKVAGTYAASRENYTNPP